MKSEYTHAPVRPTPERGFRAVIPKAVHRIGTTAGILCLLLARLPGPVFAQEGPYAFQLRGGVTLPVGDFGDEEMGWEREAGSGPSLNMAFTFPLRGALGGYLGFGQYRFSCDREVCPEGKTWTSTGFDVALRLVLGSRPLRPWIQGGFHNHRVEGRIQSPDGPVRLRSEGGGGYEVGGGVLVRVGERTSLAPGVRFGLGNVPFDGRANLGLRFLVLDLGLVLGF